MGSDKQITTWPQRDNHITVLYFHLLIKSIYQICADSSGSTDESNFHN